MHSLDLKMCTTIQPFNRSPRRNEAGKQPSTQRSSPCSSLAQAPKRPSTTGPSIAMSPGVRRRKQIFPLSAPAFREEPRKRNDAREKVAPQSSPPRSSRSCSWPHRSPESLLHLAGISSPSSAGLRKRRRQSGLSAPLLTPTLQSTSCLLSVPLHQTTMVRTNLINYSFL